MTPAVYRVSASIRDKAHKEVRNVRTLWQGPADGAKQAIVSAQQALGPLVKGEPRADTIVLHAHDPKGGVVTTTEYAEDFLIGAGASLGSALLDEHSDHGLSAEETAAAKKALEAKAVASVLRPDDVDATQRAIDKLLGSEGAGKAFEQEYLGHPIDPASVDEGPAYKTGGIVPTKDPFNEIFHGIRTHEAQQREVSLIRVSKEIFNSILDEWQGDTNKPWKAGEIFGIPVEVSRSFRPDQIQYVLKPRLGRNLGPGTVHINGKEIGRVKEFIFDEFAKQMYKELKTPNSRSNP